MAAEWHWVGAKWWKVDFHCHTPASEDYGGGHDHAAARAISQTEWLLGYMRAGVDCVAITDHNSGAWIDSLKEACKRLEAEGSPDFRPLYLFPAVEITVAGNLHMLVIMAPSCSQADVDTLLGAVRYRGTKGKSDGCTECSAVEVLAEVAKADAIAIPAHVDQPNGLFQVARGIALEQILNCTCVSAMELVNPAAAKPALYTERRSHWAEVLGSDSHHATGVAGQRFPGSHFTWVKMTTPSLDGLRLALVDGELSLKRSDSAISDPNVHGDLAIEGLCVDDAKYLGRGSSFSCQFNPWLNTIIGGRGTGKSTLLELLRLAMKRTGEIPPSLRVDFAKYQQASVTRHDEGLLTPSSRIVVCFRKDGTRFRLTWSQAEESHIIEQQDNTGEWRVAEGDIAQRFPIRMYSQKQVFELAKHPHALLVVVDDSPDVKAHDWRSAHDALVSQYLSVQAQAREVEAGLHEESSVRGQLDDVQRRLEVFEKAAHATVLKDYQQRRDQANAIDLWEKSWSRFPLDVRDMEARLQPPSFESSHVSAQSDEGTELIATVEEIRGRLDAARQGLIQIAEAMDEIRRDWQAARPSLKITRAIVDAESRYLTLVSELSAAGAGDPSEYGVLVQQRQDLEEKLKGFGRKRDALAEYLRTAEGVLKKIGEHRDLLTQRRVDFLQKVLAGNPYVQIKVLAYGNHSTVEDDIRRLLDRGSGGFERDIGMVDGDEGLLPMLEDTSRGGMRDRVEQVRGLLTGIYANDTAAVATAKDRRFVAHIQGLPPEQIDRIRCWFPEDSLEVQYSLKDGAGFKPVEQGSPGQKTAALLAFILSYGQEPLVLDQPEDDLDNHLIYDLIVNHLRGIKQRRQVIVVTHNANIVVNGDSENVVALDVRAGQTRIVCQGSLQESSIRDEICRVMEGGSDAFDQRYKRIRGGRRGI